jgi:hypothetical protein
LWDDAGLIDVEGAVDGVTGSDAALAALDL